MMNPYARVDLETARPEVLVARLYSALLRHLHEAERLSDAHALPERCRRISRALEIIGELRQSLSMERGGDIARNLDDLYGFASSRLIDANLGDDRGVGEVIGVVEKLDDAWQQIAAQPSAAQP